MENIHIYHTNDLHSHLEHWPRIREFLKTQRRNHQQQGEEVFLFDIGDFIDRWHPLTEGTKGQRNIGLLNECHFSAVTIGNNEGINLSHQDLDRLYTEAEFDVLVANLYKKGKIHPLWSKPFEVYHTKEGTRIGVVGLTAPFTHIYELLGWELSDPYEELREWIPVLKDQSDIIILLSHLGIRDDERIADEFPEIDVILGGHTHHVLPEGRSIGGTLLGAAGKYGNYVGQVTLKVENKSIKSKKAFLYDVHELPEPVQEQEQIEGFLQEGKQLLSQKVITLPETLHSHSFQETPLSRLLCQALREWCDADCALLNAGLLLGPLEGVVTDYDLLNICPHPINPCKVTLTGKELKEILLLSRDEEWPSREIKGLGFRGTVMGVIIYDQVVFQKEEIFIKGEKLDLKKEYTIALPDMFTFGFFFPNLLRHPHKQYFLPEFLRDLLKWKLQALYSE